MSNKIENFVVKNKSGKINLKASISKFEKQLLKTIFPVSNDKILKVIKTKKINVKNNKKSNYRQININSNQHILIHKNNN